MERVLQFLEKPYKASDKDLAAKVSIASRAQGSDQGVWRGQG